eukprot:Gregarina_sp_Poly_1__5773@NODE_3038_length_1436_cov_25_021183_g1922_i0_p2_GENE_NODE_3038_length_1436_cov_25_021183_g1922_i0NODE_3038_length_1436_cov_25_021183_g1922_i0_p2_ORF_typecomplete_len118_score20_82DALR_1/PF05746_15/0_053_NODE_3038_length_1436_cov_25_021183_g1922_i010041357
MNRLARFQGPSRPAQPETIVLETSNLHRTSSENLSEMLPNAPEDIERAAEQALLTVAASFPNAVHSASQAAANNEQIAHDADLQRADEFSQLAAIAVSEATEKFESVIPDVRLKSMI